jgi:hypothetical protein
MRNEFLDEIGDTLFAVAVAGAIGLSAANLAIQVNKERAAFDASAESQMLLRFGTGSTAPDARQPVLLLARHAGRAVIVSKLGEPRG